MHTDTRQSTQSRLPVQVRIDYCKKNFYVNTSSQKNANKIMASFGEAPTGNVASSRNQALRYLLAA